MKDDLTRDRLRELLVYDPETGVFRRRVGRGGPWAPGSIAGYVTKYGYRVIRVDCVLYYAHRLAWLYVHGEWPPEIDHRNGVRDDNRLSNLRVCTRAQNQANAVGKSRRGLPKGVSTSGRRFVAYIVRNGARMRIGQFYETSDEAHRAYLRAAAHHDGEFFIGVRGTVAR